MVYRDARTGNESQYRELDFDYETAFDEQFFHSLSERVGKDLARLQKKIRKLKGKCCLDGQPIVVETFSLLECSIESIHNFVFALDFLAKPVSVDKIKTTKLVSIVSIIKKVKEALAVKNLDHSRLSVETFGNEKSSIDKNFFSIILTELTENALKFSKGKVSLSIDSGGYETSVVVKDSGIGIRESEFDTVFLPFYRGTNAKLISGKGLGLSVVNKALNLLGGHIMIKSDLTGGTEIRVTIPEKATLSNGNLSEKKFLFNE